MELSKKGNGEFEMLSAFVLIQVESGFEDEVLKEIVKITNVEEAYFSYGAHDVIVKIKAESMEKLKRIVTNDIRSLNNVISTMTFVIMQ